MLFNSIHFLIFFPIVLAVYFIIPRRARYIWLLLASYYFYMSWNAKYALLIATSTIVTYLSGMLISITTRQAVKKTWVFISFAINLSILAFFKYYDFGYNVILPVGISFYTFQALSYTVDVYRKDVEAEKNLFKYALFVSFFPQLVAGPIERSKSLVTQIRKCHEIKLFNYERITEGLALMLWGYFQKMVVADRVAILVTQVYDNYMYYGTVGLVIATLFFSVQIYCDFASYSNIAVGAAKIMGFDLMENFSTPYLARSIAEFWRRWHISLSTWFKDYLYIPMGGSRCGTVRHYFNLMVTFLVSGLWHGADWKYVVWGGIHGVYQIIGRMTKKVKMKIYKLCGVNTENFSFGLMQTAVTFALVNLAWIFFRAESIEVALIIIKRIFTRVDLWNLFNDSIYSMGLSRREFNIALFVIGIVVVADIIKRFVDNNVYHWLKNQGVVFRGLLYIAAVVMIIVLGIYGPYFNPTQFVYFQF